MNIVVFSPSSQGRPGMADALLDMVRQAAAQSTVIVAGSREELIAAGADAEVLYGSMPEDLLPHFPKLRWLQSPSAGVERQLYPAFVDSSVMLTNAKGVHAPYCAEHAFALLLGLARGIHEYTRDQAARRWQKRPLVEIGGWTLGIVGMGGFGVHMARRGKGFDMYILGFDPYRQDVPAHVDELLPADGLSDLVQRSDVVMIACPHTPETHHLIDAEAFAQMKPNAYLINVTRGGVVDEAALIDALRDGRIAGAGLDVFESVF